MSGINLLNQECVNKLLSHLSTKLNIDEDDVRKAAESYGKKSKSSSPSGTARSASTTTKPKSSDVATKSKSSSVVTKPKSSGPSGTARSASTATKSTVCAYAYQKGDSAGTLCGRQAKNDVNGKMYCATHAKSMEKAATKTVVKSKPKPKTKAAAKENANEKSEDLVNRVIQHKQKCQIKKNQWGNYVDHQSNMVFDRHTSTAIGNQLDNGKIGSLTKEQIAKCELNDWPFDPPKEKAQAKNVPKQPAPKSKPKSPPVVDVEDDEDVEIEDNGIELEDDVDEIQLEEFEDEDEVEIEEIEVEDDEVEIEEVEDDEDEVEIEDDEVEDDLEIDDE